MSTEKGGILVFINQIPDRTFKIFFFSGIDDCWTADFLGMTFFKIHFI